MKLLYTRLLLLTIFCLLSLSLFAQRNDYHYLILLKDGSLLRAKKIKHINTEQVEIEIVGKNILIIDMDDVVDIDKGPRSLYSPELKKEYTYDLPDPNRGWLGVFNFAVSSSQSSSGVLVDPNFELVQCKRLSSLLNVGLGTSLNWYTGKSAMMLPIYADVRGSILPYENTHNLFYAVDLGYGFQLGNVLSDRWTTRRNDGGIYYAMAVGGQIYGKKGNAWVMSLGYQLQNNHYEEEWNGGSRITDLSYRRFVLKTGVQF